MADAVVVMATGHGWAHWVTALDGVGATRPKSMRIRLEVGSRVDVHFTSKGRTKCAVAVQHRSLPGAAAKERMKAFWTERLEALKGSIEEG